MEDTAMNKTIKRIIALALVLALGLASSALAAGTATVTSSTLNVRAGVGTGYRVLKELPRNTQVYYLGVSDLDEDGDTWYKVQYGAYATGWVFGKYCSLDGNVVSTSYCKAETGDTYIRSNPHLEGSRLDWYYVNCGGKYGWVSSKYTYLYTQGFGGLSIIPSLPSYGSTYGTLRAEGGDVYIRSNPSLSGDELGVLKKGSTASYLGERSVDNRGVVWFRVNCNGTYGWISSKYGMLYGNQVSLPDLSKPAATANYVKASGGKCNVRKSPSLDAKVYTSMEKGETASYLNESSVDSRGVVWYKVKFDGYTGWVSSKYASLNGTSSTSSNTGSYGNYVVSSAKTNVRKSPSLNGEVVEYMQKNDTATYTGSTSYDDRGVAWYSVRFNGVNGWVSSKYTKLK